MMGNDFLRFKQTLVNSHLTLELTRVPSSRDIRERVWYVDISYKNTYHIKGMIWICRVCLVSVMQRKLNSVDK